MKWSISKNLEIQNKDHVSSGEFLSLINRDIIFDLHDGLALCEPAEYHLVKTVEFDEYWSKEPFHYVGKNLIGKHAWKRDNLLKLVSSSGIINAPVFDVALMDGLQFEDGRNRFALIRDMGVEFFPALIPERVKYVFEENNLLA